MKGKQKRNMRLAVKFMIPLVLITVLQCGIFLFAVKMFGVRKQAENTAYQNFYNTAKIRGETVERILTDATEEHAELEILQQNGSEIYENHGEFDAETIKKLENLMVNSGGNGAFIILEANNGEQNKTVYIRGVLDENGENKTVLYIGNRAAAKQAGIEAAQGNLAQSISIKNGEEYDFYNKIKNAVQKNDSADYFSLGRFDAYFALGENDTESFTYTVPILNDADEFCGVVGVEYTKEYIQNALPFYELSSAGHGEYMLGMLNGDKNTITLAAQSGKFFNGLTVNGELSLAGKYVYGNTVIEKKADNATVVMSVIPLKLYGDSSPYNNKWVLCAVAEKSDIRQNAVNLHSALMTAALISLVACAAGIAIVSYSYSKPIYNLVNTLDSFNPENNEKLVLQPSGITEIDRLQDMIEKLNENVTYTAGRLSQILELSNIPLGAIEYDEKSNIVYCTENVPKLLCFDESERKSYRYTLDDFKIKTDKFLLHTKPYRSDDENGENDGSLTLQYTDDHGVSSWINFHTTVNGDKKICVVQDISETVREKIKLEYERDYDALTNLLNRRSFKKQVKEILESHKGVNIGAMVMWDMDNLKYINDTYGHDSGDRYLADAAKLFSTLSGCRGIVARMSGDEFFAFLYGFKTRKELQATVMRLHNRLRQTSFTTPDGELMPIRASGGMAWYPENGTEYDELVQHADFAMYHSKHTRRGELLEFNEQAFEKESVLLSGSETLNRFIEKRMAKFSFQPIVDLKTARVFAYECFIIPTCNELPTMFDVMRLARAQSKLYQIELLTMLGMYDAAQRHADEIGDAKIFVSSIENTQLKEEDITRIEETYSQWVNRVVLQITENEQADTQCMEDKRRFCRKNGAQLAVNNFGSGYSSEESLLMIAPDYVKLDSHIIKKINLDENRQKLLENIILCTKKLNMKTVAVGVETEAELEYLCRIGVDYAQGDIFGKLSENAEQPKSTAVEILAHINGLDIQP